MSYLKKFYRDVLLPACLLFTVLSFFFTLLFELAEVSSKMLSLISFKGLSRIFLFSLLFSWSNRLFFREKTAFWLNLLLHFLAFLGNIVAVFFLFGSYYTSAKNALVILVIFALLYVIGAAIGVTVRHFVIASRPEKKSYQRQFR